MKLKVCVGILTTNHMAYYLDIWMECNLECSKTQNLLLHCRNSKLCLQK